jgi:hypothetical protein
MGPHSSVIFSMKWSLFVVCNWGTALKLEKDFVTSHDNPNTLTPPPCTRAAELF